MERGSLGSTKYPDRAITLEKFFLKTNEWKGFSEAPFAPQMFGNAGIEHMEK
jgi:hypothetical protein